MDRIIHDLCEPGMERIYVGGFQENELIDSLSVGGTDTLEDLPLRSYYLPTTSSLLDLNSRICAGGPLALFAIARSRRSRKGARADYALLIQDVFAPHRRSEAVIDVPGPGTTSGRPA
jgi:hypothetical protein